MQHAAVTLPSRAEQPPNAPYDPPQPAPQAAAWHRAMKVIGCAPPHAERRPQQRSGAQPERVETRLEPPSVG
jgi:hypothetical protein